MSAGLVVNTPAEVVRDGPSRSGWRLASVIRRSGLTDEMPATYLPSHFTRNLKFLYGSKRCVLTANSAIRTSFGFVVEQHDSVIDDLGRPGEPQPEHPIQIVE
jgi:hypothetical protein